MYCSKFKKRNKSLCLYFHTPVIIQKITDIAFSLLQLNLLIIRIYNYITMFSVNHRDIIPSIKKAFQNQPNS